MELKLVDYTLDEQDYFLLLALEADGLLDEALKRLECLRNSPPSFAQFRIKEIDEIPFFIKCAYFLSPFEINSLSENLGRKYGLGVVEDIKLTAYVTESGIGKFSGMGLLDVTFSEEKTDYYKNKVTITIHEDCDKEE